MTTKSPNSSLVLRQLQAVAEETRFEIVRLLSDGERCVCELQAALGGAGQSRLSFHLRKLKEAEVVNDRRDGRWVYYSLVPEALEGMRAFLGDTMPREEWRSAQPKARLEAPPKDASCC